MEHEDTEAGTEKPGRCSKLLPCRYFNSHCILMTVSFLGLVFILAFFVFKLVEKDLVSIL
jgi:hypothetical protein